MDVKHNLPLLPLRDVVIFPHTVMPLFVGRKSSVSAITQAMGSNKYIFLVAQKDEKVEDPTNEELHKVGTGPTRFNLGSSYPEAIIDLNSAGKHAREKVWAVRRLDGFSNKAQDIVKKHGSRQNKCRDFVNDRSKTSFKSRINRQTSFDF